MELNLLLGREFEQIQVLRDEAAGMLAFLVIHDTRLGPAFGGIRRSAYPRPEDALADALRLAEAMTWKCAVSGIAGGGGKTVLVQAPGLDRRMAYRRIGRYVEHMCGRYYTGPDVGTDTADLATVAGETRFVARPDAVGNLAEPTALGVLAGIRVVARRLGFDSLRGVRISIQGLGEVGMRLAWQLTEAGALLTVADLRATAVRAAVAQLSARPADADGILDLEADILAPCALGGIVDDAGLGRLRARAIAGSANNVLATAAHGEELFRRGVLYAPDFVISSGALIHGALYHLDGVAPPAERILQIGDLLAAVLDRSRAEGRPPEWIAEQMARERLAAAPSREPFLPSPGP